MKVYHPKGTNIFPMNQRFFMTLIRFCGVPKSVPKLSSRSKRLAPEYTLLLLAPFHNGMKDMKVRGWHMKLTQQCATKGSQ